MQPVGDGGGSERALIAMIRQLSASGWECHVALPGPARLEPEYVQAGAILHVVPMARLTTSGSAFRWLRFAFWWPVAVARLVRLGRRTGADVIHTNSLHSWYGWAAALVLRRPHVWHAREIVFQSGAALRIERFLTAHFAARVVAVSAAVASQLDPGNVVVLTDDADPDRFFPARAGRFRAGERIADDVPLIGSVGRLDTWKGFDVLLDAVPLIREHRPEVEVVIAGAPVPGKEEHALDLERRARDLGGVHWLGPRSDIAEVMADLDVLAAVSSEPEPFGLVVVEALASGVPVVAGAAGGPLEILGPALDRGDRSMGRLVRPGSAPELASAALELLPRGRSTGEERRNRRPLRSPQREGFAALFAAVVNDSRGRHGGE